MSDQTIICPKCKHLIPLSATLTHQLKEDLTASIKDQFEKEKAAFIQNEKVKMWAIAQQKAAQKLQSELKMKDEEIQEQKKNLLQLQKQEIELRRRARMVEEKEKQLELTMERKIDEIRQQTAEKIQKEIEEISRLKLLEKDKQLEQIKKQLEEANRRATQGSQQVQGDALETDIKISLQSHFPMDTVADVPTGISGADLIQTVKTAQGVYAGVILWEVKNTKAFSREWIAKLKTDQSKAKADVCILVTKVMPEGVKTFGEMQGILVVEFGYILPLARILRNNIISIFNMKKSLEGSGEKMAYLYQYLLSPDFKNKIEAIMDAFTSLQNELNHEKNAMKNIWARREKQIERVLLSTSSLYGSLQGATGNELPKIEKLELSDGQSEDEYGDSD